MMKRLGLNIVKGLWCLGAGLTAFADYAMNLPVGVTPASHQIYDLHMLIFYT